MELQANSHRLFPKHSREAKENGEEREGNCLGRAEEHHLLGLSSPSCSEAVVEHP